MSLLSTFARNKKVVQEVERPACLHPDLAPRWKTAAAMGNPDLITSYQCCTCGETVAKEDAVRTS